MKPGYFLDIAVVGLATRPHIRLGMRLIQGNALRCFMLLVIRPETASEDSQLASCSPTFAIATVSNAALLKAGGRSCSACSLPGLLPPSTPHLWKSQGVPIYPFRLRTPRIDR